MSHRQLFNSNRIRQWQVKFYKNLDITLNFLKNINSKVINQIVTIWSNRDSFVSRPIEPKNTKKIHKFSLLSILIIHCCSVRYLTIDISLRPTHISFDLDVLFVASRGPRNRSKTTREISERMFGFKWNNINRILVDLLANKTTLLPCTLPKTSNSTESRGSLQRGSSAAILPGEGWKVGSP